MISKGLFQSTQSQLIISAKAVHGQQESQTHVPEVRKMCVLHSSHFKIYKQVVSPDLTLQHNQKRF